MRAGFLQPRRPFPGPIGHYSAGLALNTYTHSAAQMKQDTADTNGTAISQQMR